MRSGYSGYAISPARPRLIFRFISLVSVRKDSDTTQSREQGMLRRRKRFSRSWRIEILRDVLRVGPLIQEFDSMTEKTIKVPGPDHPISVEHDTSRIVVTVAGRVIADTRNALVLREASYPPAYYIPRNDVEMTLLERTDHTTYCPYKGDCAYYSIPLGGERTVNAVWTYESPYAAVKEIAQHLAFYPDRVDSIEVQPAG
jgi:uncharacterized protein (DUF427 family)